tara:strand:- start:83 stop:532 length:450 start_codon:yes stop_codon:yes gene_type:complete
MSWTGNYMATSYKVGAIRGDHKIRLTGGDTFKIALYDESASFNAATTNYTSANETVGDSYVAGGAILVPTEPTSGGTTGYVSFADVTWTTSGTIAARGAMIYNTTTDGGSGTTDTILILDFGSLRSITAGIFKVIMPTPDELNAILRIT